MRARFPSVIFAGALLSATLASSAADAYVQGVSDAGKPLYWQSSCETVTIYLNGFTQMTPDEVAKSIGAAAAAWGPDQVTCPAATGDGGSGHPYFEIITQMSSGGAPPTPAPGTNTVVFQTTSLGPDLSSEALASTSVAKDGSGHIIDAEIEINATSPDFEWANLDPGAPPGHNGIPRFDLQTVMTHEFGHFLGLAHTCIVDTSASGVGSGDDSGGTQPPDGKDAAGQMLPSCDDTGAPQSATVMWATIESDITKRILTADDARGVCAIYPPGTLNVPLCTQNSPDDGCGCRAPGASRGSFFAVALAALALAATRRRRRKR